MIRKNPKERDYQCALLLGKKAQGKSTKMRDMIDEWLGVYGKAWAGTPVRPKVLVHALSDSGAFGDIVNLYDVAKMWKVEEPLSLLADCDKWGNNRLWRATNAVKVVCRDDKDIEALHRACSRHLRYANSYFDEWTVYAKSNPAGWSIDLAFNHRNYTQECVFACHKLMSVPNKLASADVFGKIIMMKTGEYEPKQSLFDRFSCSPQLKRAFYVVRDAPVIMNVVQYHCYVDTVKQKIYEWDYIKGRYQPLGKKPLYKMIA